VGFPDFWILRKVRAKLEVLKFLAKAAPPGQGALIGALFGLLDELIAEIEALKQSRGA
jgi:hypothetical protein